MTKNKDSSNQNRIQIGNVHFGEVNAATICYTLKYLQKPKTITKHDSRNPEFSLMSKGIGRDYLQSKMASWHKAAPSERSFLPLGDGVKANMPRYYREKLYSKTTQKQITEYRAAKRIFSAKTQFIPDHRKLYENTKAASAAAIRKMHSPRKTGKL